MNFTQTHKTPITFGDRIALRIVKSMRIPADLFFAKKYGHRAIVLETVAAVPGMVGGMLLHLKSLRLMKPDEGWIKTLLEEAENERQHLMAFTAIAQPTMLERSLVLMAQGVFFNLYFIMYLINPKICHRIVGYLEEEACISYTEYLKMIETFQIDNVAIPEWCKEYWHLRADARLHDLVIAIRNDEANHRDVNHGFAEKL